MRKYQKITLEVEIAIMTDAAITEGQIDRFSSKAKKGIKEALLVANIRSAGGIKFRTIMDEATVEDINKINV